MQSKEILIKTLLCKRIFLESPQYVSINLLTYITRPGCLRADIRQGQNP